MDVRCANSKQNMNCNKSFRSEEYIQINPERKDNLFGFSVNAAAFSIDSLLSKPTQTERLRLLPINQKQDDLSATKQKQPHLATESQLDSVQSFPRSKCDLDFFHQDLANQVSRSQKVGKGLANQNSSLKEADGGCHWLISDIGRTLTNRFASSGEMGERSTNHASSLEEAGCQLETRWLWEKFHQLGTEMILTKTGRRMFPPLRLTFRGLDPHSLYSVHLSVVLVDEQRYRYLYHRSSWVPVGRTTSVNGKSRRTEFPHSLPARLRNRQDELRKIVRHQNSKKESSRLSRAAIHKQDTWRRSNRLRSKSSLTSLNSSRLNLRSSQIYRHPDGPFTGSRLLAGGREFDGNGKGGSRGGIEGEWEEGQQEVEEKHKRFVVSFDKVKMTNCSERSQESKIYLESMHRYQPVIYLVLENPGENTVEKTGKTPSGKESKELERLETTVNPGLIMSNHSPFHNCCNYKTFVFPETSFITVTAYQNHRITQLKIESNPYAKGFRRNQLNHRLLYEMNHDN